MTPSLMLLVPMATAVLVLMTTTTAAPPSPMVATRTRRARPLPPRQATSMPAQLLERHRRLQHRSVWRHDEEGGVRAAPPSLANPRVTGEAAAADGLEGHGAN